MNTIKIVLSNEEKIMFKNGKYSIADILANIGEANTSYNDLQREKISILHQIHGKCYLVAFNSCKNGNLVELVEYENQLVYNFEYDIVIPEKSTTIIDLLQKWRNTSNTKYIDSLHDEVTKLGGLFLHWS
jgi:hypothetical protein